MTDDDWRGGALCAQVDLQIFFPDQGEDVRPAKAICRACDVRVECLAEAMDRMERFGIWGGTTAKERSRMRVARARSGEEAA